MSHHRSDIPQTGARPDRNAVVEMRMRGEITTVEAAAMLGLGRRQMARIIQRAESGGDVARHGNSGRAANNSVPPEARERILFLSQTKYKGLSDGQLTRMLQQEERMPWSRQTVRRLLRQAGIPPRRGASGGRRA